MNTSRRYRILNKHGWDSWQYKLYDFPSSLWFRMFGEIDGFFRLMGLVFFLLLLLFGWVAYEAYQDLTQTDIVVCFEQPDGLFDCKEGG